eukprot:NODE_664_length_5412_cov_0.289855.p1 type:complete len:494 gc:universal NODE_664_length_5412_cov_0.289855:4129-2648(-)
MIFLGCISAKIVVGCVLAGTYSHARPILSYLAALQDRGHEVAFATITENQRYLTGTSIPFLDLGHGPDVDRHWMWMVEEEDPNDILTGLVYQKTEIYDKHYEIGMNSLAKVLQDHKVDYFVCDVLATPCFDTAIKNNVDYAVATFYLGFSGFYQAPYNPSPITNKVLEEEWGFLHRFLNTWYILPNSILRILPTTLSINKLRSQYNVPHSLNSKDIFQNRLNLLNTLPGFWNVEMPPNVIQLGPVFEKSRSKMDSDLKRWLDAQSSSNNKVAFMAFGSLAYLPSKQLLKIFNGLRCAKYKIVFASKMFNSSEFTSSDLESVYVLKWAAQQDILHHPAVSIFVSHGGIESLHESIEAGKPILVKPFYGDQSINANKAKGVGIGEYIMDKYSFTSEEVCDKATLLQLSSSYKQKIKRFQSLLQLKLKSNIEVAADYIEYVMEHGIQALTTRSQSMNAMAASNYDVILVGYFILFAILVMVAQLTRKMWRIVSNRD